ncbi:hypothetical protein BCR35DRAFT_336096 [Leucosporidium creatinivorum]|uniref:Uncharacterized protein n=1 Tax=Leucosporidium creatinivorum TaxID=106004 RepID=A0A1Y2CQI5_9BASI|nr:hypothetical protein BCR35DRAFT_336096 [Leucosporidium creatinivorum]
MADPNRPPSRSRPRSNSRPASSHSDRDIRQLQSLAERNGYQDLSATPSYATRDPAAPPSFRSTASADRRRDSVERELQALEEEHLRARQGGGLRRPPLQRYPAAPIDPHHVIPRVEAGHGHVPTLTTDPLHHLHPPPPPAHAGPSTTSSRRRRRDAIRDRLRRVLGRTPTNTDVEEEERREEHH